MTRSNKKELITLYEKELKTIYEANLVANRLKINEKVKYKIDPDSEFVYVSEDKFFKMFNEVVKESETAACGNNSGLGYTFDQALAVFCEDFPVKNYQAALNTLALTQSPIIRKLQNQPWFAGVSPRLIGAQVNDDREKPALGGYKNNPKKQSILKGIQTELNNIQNVEKLIEDYNKRIKSDDYKTLQKHRRNFFSTSETDSCKALRTMFQTRAIEIEKNLPQPDEIKDNKSEVDDTNNTRPRMGG